VSDLLSSAEPGRRARVPRGGPGRRVGARAGKRRPEAGRGPRGRRARARGLRGRDDGRGRRRRPRRPRLAGERGGAAPPPRVAAPAPARHADLGRPRRPPRPRDARPRARGAGRGRLRGDRADLRPAVHPGDDAHRALAGRGGMDAATWGMFAEGWRDGTGADADHLKTTADIDACLAAGFSMFTIDPGEHVDPAADAAGAPALRASGRRRSRGPTSRTPRRRCGTATSAGRSRSST
jgi:hypothetical protein